ncbi:hypothetical protein Ancab_028380 [Ancistrocladus abbreviatus]
MSKSYSTVSLCSFIRVPRPSVQPEMQIPLLQQQRGSAHFEGMKILIWRSLCSNMVDWLIEGPHGYSETNPSTSSEHAFISPDGKPASVSHSSTMDIALIREVFSFIVSAANILGRGKDDLIKRVPHAQTTPYRIARGGTIMEWAQDFKDADIHNQHLSHLFGLFSGHTITPEKTLDLCRAAEKSLFNGGKEGPGWSTTWKAALWAHLRDNKHAHQMIKFLFRLVDTVDAVPFEGGIYSN